jgi:hypothetical protein
MDPLTPQIGRPHGDVISRQMGDGAVLVDLGTSTIFELNRTGARVWALLEQGVPPGAIAPTLVGEFQVEVEAAAREVDQLLEALTAAGLLRS